MKNLLVSALLVGALACPFAYAADEMAAESQDQQTEMAKEPKKSSKKRTKKKGAKKHEKHANEHHKHHKHHKNQEDGNKTPAEEKIERETEFNNR